MSNNISGKINLASLQHALVKSKKGADCILIPIKVNNLFKSDKGNVFLDISANEYVDEDKKTTHIVKQNIPKEKYEALRAEDKYPPTLGNLTDWSQLGGAGEPTPDAVDADVADEGADDLPF